MSSLPLSRWIVSVICLGILFSLVAQTSAFWSAIPSQNSTRSQITANGGTIIYVNSTADIVADDGTCTLREAITSVNLSIPSGTMEGECVAGTIFTTETVIIPAGTYRLTLVGADENNNNTGDLDVVGSVTIQGDGARTTVIDGNNTDRVMDFFADNVTVEELSIMGGNAISDTYPNNSGGGIFMGYGSNFTLRNVAIRDNMAINGDGGGIYLASTTSTMTLTVDQSEISDNQSLNGGGVFVDGDTGPRTIEIANTTISNNQAVNKGGGILTNSWLDGYFLDSVTIVNNRAEQGAGIWNSWDVTLTSVILAQNFTEANEPANCFMVAGKVGTFGGNLVASDVLLCPFYLRNTDTVSNDPGIESLNYNGGNTRTHALLLTSLAIDSGNCPVEMTEDQRGEDRFVDIGNYPNDGTTCDTGAYELRLLPGTPSLTPTSTNTPSLTSTPTGTPTTTPTATPTYLPSRTPTLSPTALPPGDIVVNSALDEIADEGQCTLREAITAANTNTASGAASGECAAGEGSDIIILPAGIYTLTRGGVYEGNNMHGDLDVSETIVLLGAGAEQTIIDANGIDRVFEIRNVDLTVIGVTLRNGHARDATSGINPESGGAINIQQGRIALIQSIVTNSRAGDGNPNGGNGESGGGIWLGFRANLVLLQSVVQNNQTGLDSGTGLSGSGGGIWGSSNSSMTISQSTIHNNEAGSRALNLAGQGGGIYTEGTLNVQSSTIDTNWSGVGGGIFTKGLSTLAQTTISSNTGLSGGGGIYTENDLTMVNMTITNNRSYGTNGTGIYHPGNYEDVITVIIGNSIIGSNPRDDNVYGQDCHGNIYSLGYNFISLAYPNSCRIDGILTGNQYGVQPFLVGLADNLGPTRTHAFGANSTVRDAGSCLFGFVTDQRGLPRPSDLPTYPNRSDGCDIGAYKEFPAPAPEGSPTALATDLFLPLIQRDGFLSHTQE
jgi:CSLREA domain-containing protein